MSKKLLMNNFSNNGLLPEQNGLVCWLDAFDLTTYKVGAIWEDRTGNNNGTVSTPFEFGSVGNGVLNAKSCVNIPNPTKNLNEYTVEVGYQDVTGRYWLGLWGNTSDNATFKGFSIYQQDSSIGTYPVLFANVPISGIKLAKNYITTTVESNRILIYSNGKKVYESSRETLPSEADYFCFMARKPNNASVSTNTGADMLKNNWYFLRIYNRTLTEEEILNNYNYELSLQRGE